MTLKPSHNNPYPLKGILLKGTHPERWIADLQRLTIPLGQLTAYPLPGTAANTVWGCLVVFQQSVDQLPPHPHIRCQVMAGLLYIPENTLLYPKTTESELRGFLLSKPHFMHPEIGMVALEEEIDWASLLQLPPKTDLRVMSPAPGVHIPTKVSSIQVQALSENELQQQINESISSSNPNQLDQPLRPLEKLRYQVYRLLFQPGQSSNDNSSRPPESQKRQFLNNLSERFSNINFSFLERWQRDFEQLQDRNKKQVDRLMDLLRKNPAEGLKYAIPLDESGASRGPNTWGEFHLGRRWGNFSLFDNRGLARGSGGAKFQESEYARLRRQYQETATALIKKEDYQKAAFVYLKLLQNPRLAAETLKKGHLYQQAAVIYHDKLNDKQSAANCYEKGHMLTQAISLYEELEKYENAGDLYYQLNQHQKATAAYWKQIDRYQNKAQYVKAALLCKHKLEDHQASQEILLQGWDHNSKPIDCLKLYFDQIHKTPELKKAIHHIYQEKVNNRNRVKFLQVIHREYKKDNELAPEIRDIAYELVADLLPAHPEQIAQLHRFNPKDRELEKDTTRFRWQRLGRKRSL